MRELKNTQNKTSGNSLSSSSRDDDMIVKTSIGTPAAIALMIKGSWTVPPRSPYPPASAFQAHASAETAVVAATSLPNCL